MKYLKLLLSAYVTFALLVGCTSSEELLRSYLDRAQEHFASGEFAKASLDVRSALQIDEKDTEARYLKARIHEQAQEWQEMLANLRRVLELDSNHIPARIRYGTFLISNLQSDDALHQANAVLTIRPEHAEAHALRGAALFQSGQQKQAILAAETALGFDPGNVSAIAVLTQVYKARNPDLALEIIRQGIESQTQSAALRMLEISVYEETGDVPRASEAYQGLIADYPENLYYLHRYVALLEEHEQENKAIELLRKVGQGQPDDERLKLWLVQFLVDNDDLAAAEKALREFVSAYPEQRNLRFELAAVLLAQHRVDEARSVYRSLISEAPDTPLSLRARNAWLRLELGAGNRDRAEALLSEIFQIEPKNSDGLLIGAQLAYAEGRLDEAIANARTILRVEPDFLPALEMLAVAQMKIGAEALAVDYNRQILSLRPGDLRALIALSKHALKENDPELAGRLASSALRTNPDGAEAARLLVAALAEQGKLEEAFAQAKQLAASSRNRVLGTYLLGRLHQRKGDLAAATEEFERTLAMEPGVVEPLDSLIKIYVTRNRRDLAFEYLRRHLQQYPAHSHALILLGELEYHEGDFEKASDTFSQVIKQFPEVDQGYVSLGDLRYEQEGPGNALGVYLSGLERLPQSRLLLVRAARAQAELGEYDSAISLYERVLAVSDDIEPKNNLAMLFADYQPTDENIRKALTMMRPYSASTTPAILDTLGWLYYRLGDGEQAVRYIEAALKNGGEDIVIRYHLGMAYALTGRDERAREELSAALETDQAFPGVDQARIKLEELQPYQS